MFTLWYLKDVLPIVCRSARANNTALKSTTYEMNE